MFHSKYQSVSTSVILMSSRTMVPCLSSFIKICLVLAWMPAWKMLEGVNNDRVHMSQIARQSPAILCGPTLTYIRDVHFTNTFCSKNKQKYWTPPTPTNTNTHIKVRDDVFMIGTPLWVFLWQTGMTKHVHAFTPKATWNAAFGLCWAIFILRSLDLLTSIHTWTRESNSLEVSLVYPPIFHHPVPVILGE